MKDLLPTYWSLEPATREHVFRCYIPPHFFQSLCVPITYQLSYWKGYTHIETKFNTIDELIAAIAACSDDACWIDIYDANDGDWLGDGSYEIVESDEELVQWTEESEDAHGLADVINERWRMQRKGGGE